MSSSGATEVFGACPLAKKAGGTDSETGQIGMLKIEGLRVSIGEAEVLKGVNLVMGNGQRHVLLGPNACGKTTLALAILGHPAHKVTGGSMVFDGEDLTRKSIHERARLGIGLTYQSPPDIRGVKLADLIRLMAGGEPWDPLTEPEETVATPFLHRVGLDPTAFLTRDVNVGFSGGEKKRSELAQVFAMKARLMLLDEPDSGVDIDSVKLIGTQINTAVDELGSSVLVITHHRHILQYLQPDMVHVMYDGKIVSSTQPEETLPEIEAHGYQGYVRQVLGGV